MPIKGSLESGPLFSPECSEMTGKRVLLRKLIPLVD